MQCVCRNLPFDAQRSACEADFVEQVRPTSAFTSLHFTSLHFTSLHFEQVRRTSATYALPIRYAFQLRPLRPTYACTATARSSQVSEAFDALDVDGSGTLDYEEFVAVRCSPPPTLLPGPPLCMSTVDVLHPNSRLRPFHILHLCLHPKALSLCRCCPALLPAAASITSERKLEVVRGGAWGRPHTESRRAQLSH